MRRSKRLGLRTTADGRVIEGAVALRYPSAVADAADLECEIADARLSYGVFTQGGEGSSRFPTSGWLDGSVEDLADLVRLVSVPQHAVDRGCRSSGTGHRPGREDHRGDCGA